MDAPTNSPVRFGVFELDAGAGELRRSGHRVALQPQPLEILRALIERPGQVVTREELRCRLWTNGAYVDFDRSLNKAIVKLRDALGDDADSPRYIETLPRHGYRFISLPQVHAHVGAGIAATQADAVSSPSAAPPTPYSAPSALGLRGWIGGALIILVVLAGTWAISHYRGASKPPVLTSSGVPPAIHSLVVLPLENLSGDKEQEYFADGMTDTLITDLAQIGSLRVISRTSAMHFKGSKETLPKIGHDLQVDAIVEGTVTRSENRVRVTAQLIETRTDHHLWAKTYERDLKNVLALQDEIAHDITEQVRVKLTPTERTLLMQVHTVAPEAHDAYLRGRYWWSKRGAEVWKGLGYFERAIAKDPSYALAYAGIADSFIILGSNGNLSPQEAFPKAKEAATKALGLDPSLAQAHASLAIVEFFYDRDWSGAENEFKRALALNSNDATAHHLYSTYLTAMGRFDEALKEIERARELDPFSSPVNWWFGRSLYYARRYDDALRQFQTNAEMFPSEFEFYNNIADVYEHKRMFAEAFAARQQALSMQHDPTVTTLARAYVRSGYRGWLLKKIEILEQAPPQRVLTGQKESRLDAFKYYGIAYFYALLDDEPHAMTYLERASDGGNSSVLFVRVSPNWDSLRSSARYRDLIRRIGLPPLPSEKN